ncbi:MMPL family transporter [Georgenia sp. Z1344]|uniref:MMPL family transporter n=1 Tax=Georgenia sp. Z1344 TaxID=3416706 RepID=UPI003CF12C2B
MAGRGSTRARTGPWRGLVVLALVVAWVAIGGIGGQYMGRLSEVQENDSAMFLPTSAESVRAAEAVEDFTDTSTLPVLLVVRSADGGPMDEEDLAAADELAASAGAATLSDGRAVEEVLTAPPVVVPSEDGEAAMVVLGIDTALTAEPLPDGENLVGSVVTEVRGAVADGLETAGLEGWVTGPGGFAADLSSAFGSVDAVLLLTALVVVLVILLLVYRSPILPFAVLLTAVFALALAGLVVYHLADAGVVQLNGQTQGIMSILVIGAATDYCLLLVARHREELVRHEDPFAAMRVAWRASLPPIAASAGTVALGLLCLLLSDLGSNASLGPVAAVGIAAAFVAALTLLPTLLLVGGRRSRVVFWPRMPRAATAGDGRADGADRAGGGAHALTSTAPEDSRGGWGRIARLVGRRDRRTWIVTSLALLVAAAFVVTLDADGTSDSEVFLAQSDAVDGEEVLAEHFPAGAVQPLDVVADADVADEIVAAAEGTDGVASASVVTEGAAQGGGPAGGGPPGGAPAEGGEPLEVDGRVHVQVTTEAPADSEEAVSTVGALRTAVHDVDPDALVGGAAAGTLDTRTTAERDLRVIIPAVLLVILLTLVVLLRSVLAPVLLLAANVLSFAAAMGIVAVIFNHVLDLPGADPTVPLFGFVFLVALGIDYTIFLMTRAREESLNLGTRRGVRRALSVTGGVITSAGVVLAATFAALGVVPLLFLLQLAIIVALGVLIDTLVVRTLLVPALVHDIGRGVWWPRQARFPHDDEDRGEAPPALDAAPVENSTAG